MYKTKILNVLTGKEYKNKFETEEEANAEIVRLLKKKHVLTPARKILKGCDYYNPELVESEEAGVNAFGDPVVFVNLKANYIAEVTEVVGAEKKKEDSRKRVEEARSMANASKLAREDSMMVLDYFIGLLNARKYTRVQKRTIATNVNVRQAQGALMLGDMDLAKTILKDLKSDELIKKSDVNKTIKLINDLTL